MDSKWSFILCRVKIAGKHLGSNWPQLPVDWQVMKDSSAPRKTEKHFNCIMLVLWMAWKGNRTNCIMSALYWVHWVGIMAGQTGSSMWIALRWIIRRINTAMRSNNNQAWIIYHLGLETLHHILSAHVAAEYSLCHETSLMEWIAIYADLLHVIYLGNKVHLLAER